MIVGRITRFVLLLLLAGASIVGGIWALSSSDLVKQSEKAGAHRAHHRRSQPPARPLADDLHRTLAALPDRAWRAIRLPLPA